MEVDVFEVDRGCESISAVSRQSFVLLRTADKRRLMKMITYRQDLDSGLNQHLKHASLGHAFSPVLVER